MPRNPKRKTDRGKVPLHVMKNAAKFMMEKGISSRKAASYFEIPCHVTLYRFAAKMKNGDDATVGYKPVLRVFSSEQEQAIVDYIIKAAKHYFGLGPVTVCKLALELAMKYELKFPTQWTNAGMAGREWLRQFLKRHPSLSIRVPQATSIARATAFNPHTVSQFFDKLGSLMDKYKFHPGSIYNFDETGVTTVQKPDRVITLKGTHQVGAMTSGERGTLVTVGVAVNAIGNSVPPIYIFPRKNFRDHFIRDGPPGCIGTANAWSGWMQKEDFLVFMRHFVDHVRPSKERPILFLLDNHQSHLSISVIDFCKENGVIMFSFPPHCSHRLQPLDRGVFGPLKRFINSQCGGWMKSNPGKVMTIYDIPGIVSSSLPKALNPGNILGGFRVNGIVPFYRHIFDEDDFAAASLTDRPLPSEAIEMEQDPLVNLDSPILENEILFEVEPNEPFDLEGFGMDVVLNVPTYSPESSSSPLPQAPITPAPLELPSTSTPVRTTSCTADSSLMDPSTSFDPETVSPMPVTPPRKNTFKRGRPKGKSAVLTDTPERNALAEAEAKKSAGPAKRRLNLNEKKTSTKKKRVQKRSTKSSDDCTCFDCQGNYLSDKGGEIWIQCLNCKRWAHEKGMEDVGAVTGDAFVCMDCQ